MIKKILAIFLIVIGTSGFTHAQNLDARIDSILTNLFKDKDEPGGVFMVAKHGKPIYCKAFGKANLELDVNMKTDNIFQLGSMTKQFTAIAILQLAEKNMVNLNAPIYKYIPDYPSGDKITIHHLLTHTSGIKDFTKMKSLQQISQQNLSPKQMIDFFKNEPVDFPPGDKFEYNNSGYVILGHIIELVSGKTYEEYINQNIFEKAGMKDSHYASDVTLVKNRAYGYQKKMEKYVNKTSISFSIPFSSGSLMSTADNMLKWQNALNKNLIVGSKTLKKAFTKYKLNNDEVFNYGYGWHIKEINGTPVRAHGGSIFGFKTMGVYIPDEDIYVIGLTNCDCNSPTQITMDIAALTLEVSGKKSISLIKPI
ncbi:serine hydrolase domain-containing protein [Pedobacter rhodius]|uniref:Serine hydrolase n=1 Tax=Pedobacter rhodius TaxID=3004098 RepID=A0ABT4L2Z9_9SPHI|nr:serine hydrolase domain-containing protein [Pedobacter sp. SJ11]MCZ4225558.1 serine hydrolase [Pedobacter sp. SJ11]